MLFKVTILCLVLTTVLALPYHHHHHHHHHDEDSPEDDSNEFHSGEFDSSSEEEDEKPRVHHVKHDKEEKATTLPPVETSEAVVEQATQAVVVEQATEAVAVVEEASQSNVQIVQDEVKVEESHEKKLTINHEEPKYDGVTEKTSEPGLQTDQAPITNIQLDQSTPVSLQELSAPQSNVEQIFGTQSALPLELTNALDNRNSVIASGVTPSGDVTPTADVTQISDVTPNAEVTQISDVTPT